MKTLLTTALIMSVIFFGRSQDISSNPQPSDELKINAFNLITFTYMDLSYERLLNEEASLGVSVLFNIGEENEILDYFRNFSITPYYRQYFSKQYAEGFFVEGFGMLNSGEDFYYSFDEQGNENNSKETYTDFALGISVGGKFVTKRGFIAEIYTGLGRNLLGDDTAPEIVSRGGISLGYRF
ncbi:hypothetical protein SB49_13265 [Sediminicola sp. YIK13]|uniref:DUF3575 domain-containing protein n=1 Tax=Sediminicola sp. YIK13 TaxID=1453352 RepID=UPI00072109AD|nr:DUF3575 domain-containing protein [Sediminicola sp. YIK13]ALM08667.1 hypothetical protein SB49_13265 [Sediminicola sp. YIK13]